jgi:hypothetical protein
MHVNILLTLSVRSASARKSMHITVDLPIEPRPGLLVVFRGQNISRVNEIAVDLENGEVTMILDNRSFDTQELFDQFVERLKANGWDG